MIYLEMYPIAEKLIFYTHYFVCPSDIRHLILKLFQNKMMANIANKMNLLSKKIDMSDVWITVTNQVLPPPANLRFQ